MVKGVCLQFRKVWQMLARTTQENRISHYSLTKLRTLASDNSVALRGAILLLAFAWTDRTLIAPLLAKVYSQIDFREPILITQLLQTKAGGTFALVAFFILVAARKTQWGSGFGRVSRTLVVACSGALAWAYTTYTFNYFSGEYHILDRVLLVSSTVLLFFRPAFIGIYLLSLIPILSQFSATPLAFSYTDKIPLLQNLYLFGFFCLAQRCVQKLDFSSFVFASLVSLSAFYLAAGLAKVPLYWVVRNDTSNLLLGAYLQNGWLSLLNLTQVLQLKSITASFDMPLKVTVLIAELGLVLAISNRKAFIAILATLVSMHAGIFLASGICFWKWVILDAAWIFCLLRFTAITNTLFFSRGSAAISIISAIVFLTISNRPVWLGWLDSPFVSRFEIQAETTSGEKYALPPSEMAPFDMPFAQGRLYFLTKTEKISDCFGSVNSKKSLSLIDDFARDLSKQSDPRFTLRPQIGVRRANDTKREEFASLMHAYISAVNAGMTTGRSWFAPPQHISTSVVGKGLEPSEMIAGLRIILHEYCHHDGLIIEVHREVVFEATAHAPPL